MTEKKISKLEDKQAQREKTNTKYDGAAYNPSAQEAEAGRL
jgi:hypothetical protein